MNRIMRTWLWVLFVFLSFSMGRAQGDRKICVIPKPQNVVMGGGEFVWNARTEWHTNLKGKEKILLDRYLQMLPYRLAKGKVKADANIVRLTLESLPNTTNPEAYLLQVTPKEIEVKANTGAGLFYGLQTLFQLGGGINSAELNIPCVTISDEPRFVHRGYMLDVSRHFFPKEFILKMLDVLAYYKINVFHFHLVDTGGWRIEISRYPKLTEMTAYRPAADLDEWRRRKNVFCTKEVEGAYGGYYTKDDIREIVAYAAARHITVIPEIDMPGHSREVLWAYPEYACRGKNASNSNELCIGQEETFTFCKNVLKEVMELFPSAYIHIGGDEANRNIWKECDRCKKRMAEEHIDGVPGLQNYFTNSIERFLAAHGKTLIGWDEILDGDVSPRAVVMSWREEVDGGGEALRRGHRVIQSPTSHCYLDYFQDNPYFEPQGLLGYTPLKQTYGFEPLPEGDFDKSLVLGVQGNLWTEHVSDTDRAEYMTFPRMLAVAEVGWTNPALKSYPDFRERVLKALDYLRAREIHPFNLSTEIGPRPEAEKPVCSLAKGKKVTYLKPYNREFAASGETTLTDGWLGNWNSNGARWQGFGGDMDVVIDLEQPTELHAVKASFIQILTGGQYIPEKLEISISDDGKNYRSLYEHTYETDNKRLYEIYLFGWVGKSKARYIRFHATRAISWGNILSDEIIVK